MSFLPVHVYRAPEQPATKYSVDLGPGVGRHWMQIKPRALCWCECCKRRRQARFCTVRVYYDCHRYSCAPGKGCKAPGWAPKKRRKG